MKLNGTAFVQTDLKKWGTLMTKIQPRGGWILNMVMNMPAPIFKVYK
jgi:hypothetical protein